MSMRFWKLVLLTIGTSRVSALPPAISKDVKTSGGTISGMSTGDGTVISFEGIPYAAPPVGVPRQNAIRAQKGHGLGCSEQFSMRVVAEE